MKKIMRRLLSLMVVSAVFAQFGAVYAQQLDPEMVEMYRSQREEQLFEQMSELVSEKIRLDARSVKDTVRMTEIDDEMSQIDAALEAVGVHKMDANDPEDLALVAEVMLGDQQSAQTYSTTSVEPDLSFLTDMYTVYKTSGSTVINDVTYPYYTFRVYGETAGTNLYLNTLEIFILGAQNTVLSELLSYNFSFIVSSLLGTLPTGIALDWTLGTIFTILESYPANTSIYTQDSLYGLFLSANTHMMYHYIQADGMWALCGSRAVNISWGRTDVLHTVLSGMNAPLSESLSGASSTGSYAVSTYLNYYLNYHSPKHDSIGKIGVVTATGTTKYFSPPYVGNPVDL